MLSHGQSTGERAKHRSVRRWLREKSNKRSSTPEPPEISSQCLGFNQSSTESSSILQSSRINAASQPTIDPYKSLWDLAYDDLCQENKELTDTLGKILLSDQQFIASAKLDYDPDNREAQMSRLIAGKLDAEKKERWRIKIGDHEIEIRQQIDRIVKILLGAKDFVSPIASMDPIHAGLPWAGICVLLPVSTFSS